LFKSCGIFTSCLIIYGISISLCFVAGLIDGTLNSTPQLLGIYQDYPFYVLWIVMLILSGVLYRFSQVLEHFFKTGIEPIINKQNVSEDTLLMLDSKLSKVLHPSGVYKVIKHLITALFIIFWLINLINGFDPVANYGIDIWHSAYHPFGFVILKSLNLIYFTVFSFFCYKYIASLAAVTWLFMKISKNDGFIIRPLSPDNCSGLKLLSDLSLYYVYIIIPFFLFFIVKYFMLTKFLPSQQIILGILILVLFISFFLPLGAVHGAMKRAKDKELDEIDTYFRELNDEVKRILSKKVYQNELFEKLGILEKMDFLYNSVKRMPVWPFNLGNLGRVLAASFIPIAIFLLNSLTDPESIIHKLLKIFGN
jgi:hypothetical protein